MQEIVCFYKPEDENGYLSNWFEAEFEINGIRYSSMEQYMMHQKAHLFGDYQMAAGILKTSDPGQIKTMGRRVQGYDDKIWNGIRQIVVYRGLLEKFLQNEELLVDLLGTGNCILAECSARDKVWGIGLSIEDSRRMDTECWTGQNLLGFSLMEVRNEILRNK